MDMEHVNRRKTYVQDIRKSFDTPNTNRLSEKSQIHKEGNSLSFFKVRLLFAIFIFAAFVLCDQTNTKFYSHSTNEIIEKIQTTYDYANLQNYVMMLTQKSKL